MVDTIWPALAIVLLLILANGLFAGAELAIVSVRRSRIAQLAAAGSKAARLVEELQADPHRFLATVQIGVTLVGTMASAIGGAAAVELIKPVLQRAPLAVVRQYAEPLALATVVGTVAYISLVLGELVPKALALAHAERFALAVARPISILARIGGFAVYILTVSSRGVLALLGVRGQGEQGFLTKEEIQHLVAEGRELGVVSIREQEIIRNAFRFSRTKVREVMVPRLRVTALDLERSPVELVQLVMERQYSRYPVYRADPENIVGFLHAKDLVGQAVEDEDFDLERLVRPIKFVPESKDIDQLLRDMQRLRIHMVVVIDEYGGLSGIATTEDLLEELVGDIVDEHDPAEFPRIKRLKKGVYTVDAQLSLGDLEDLLDVRFPEQRAYETLAGLILFELGHLPREGEQLCWDSYLLTCTWVTETAIRRVKIEPQVSQET